MPKKWSEDTELVSSLAGNMLDAMTVFPKSLIHTDALTHTFAMPMSHIQLLAMLADGDLSITELSQRTGIAKPNITPMVDVMCEKQLVKRVRSEQDRRVVYLTLDESGKACIDQVRKALAEQIAAWPVQYSKSEVRELNNALMTLIRLSKTR